MPTPFDVDAVITWVDGDDPAHRRKLQAFLQESGSEGMAAAEPTRFGDCGEIEYCVASLLRFAPWLRTIHIVSDEQTPALIAQLKGSAFEHRVRVVDHREFFVGYEQYLPTFSNRSIECLLWRIPDLAERFLYLNDDFQLIQPLQVGDFFREGGIVLRGHWRASGVRRWKLRVKAVGAVLARLLGRAPRSATARPGNHAAQALSAKLAGSPERYLQVQHLPHPMRRSVLARFFDANPQLLEDNLRHRLRTEGQFVTTALAAHMELVAGTALIDNRLTTIRLKPSSDSLRALASDMARADGDPAVAFSCVQSLDLAPTRVRELVNAWLDARVGRLQDLLRGSSIPALADDDARAALVAEIGPGPVH